MYYSLGPRNLIEVRTMRAEIALGYAMFGALYYSLPVQGCCTAQKGSISASYATGFERPFSLHAISFGDCTGRKSALTASQVRLFFCVVLVREMRSHLNPDMNVLFLCKTKKRNISLTFSELACLKKYYGVSVHGYDDCAYHYHCTSNVCMRGSCYVG